MDDLMKAINDHSTYDGADFWDNLYEEHGEQYRSECAQTNAKADFSGFQVWADERDLVGDDEVYANG